LLTAHASVCAHHTARTHKKRYSLLNWATLINNEADPPLVHSVSYGNDERQQTGAAYVRCPVSQTSPL
jgi:hypothetical protein